MLSQMFITETIDLSKILLSMALGQEGAPSLA